MTLGSVVRLIIPRFLTLNTRSLESIEKAVCNTTQKNLEAAYSLPS